jgi:peptidyl-prolyl cis-trans isomerase C
MNAPADHAEGHRSQANPLINERAIVLQTDSQSPEAETETSAPKSKLLRFLKEPLFHFILAGAAIYLLFGWFGPKESEEAVAENTIVITAGELDWLADTWLKKWNRPPTEQEMLGMVQQQLRETVLYREAISMGLDKDDVIIRRRLAQKLEFLAQDLIQPELPTDEELQAYFETNLNTYRASDLITFTHVFLDPDKRDDQTLADAEKLKTELIGNATVPAENSDLGDTFMLQSYYPERAETDISKLFGNEFARSIMELETEEWHGPVLSGYGTHLVYVHALQNFAPPTFEQVSARVAEDWENEKRAELNDEYIASLLKRYTVVVEGESEGEGEADAAVTEVSQ